MSGLPQLTGLQQIHCRNCKCLCNCKQNDFDRECLLLFSFGYVTHALIARLFFYGKIVPNPQLLKFYCAASILRKIVVVSVGVQAASYPYHLTLFTSRLQKHESMLSQAIMSLYYVCQIGSSFLLHVLHQLQRPTWTVYWKSLRGVLCFLITIRWQVYHFARIFRTVSAEGAY